MFVLAISIGVVSYIIYFLGIFGKLYPLPVTVVGILYFLWLGYYFHQHLVRVPVSIKALFINENRLVKVSFILLIAIMIVDIVGALSPELAFDALWYHLTLPKYFLEQHTIEYIPGGLLYYSVMPKLTETLYILPLSLGGEILVKLLHYSFGVLSLIALYKLSREFLSRQIALLVVLLFASNLVFMWESTTAYIDLSRTFFEIMTLWGYFVWIRTRKEYWLTVSAIMVGLAITTKVLALGSLGIMTLLLLQEYWRSKVSLLNSLKKVTIYGVIALLIPLPWFVLAYIATSNPLYPFFSIYEAAVHPSLLSPWIFVSDISKIFLFADDPISPMYSICLPLVIIFAKRFSLHMKTVLVYAALSLLVWYVTPRTGGGRFILPYLPAFSLLVGAIIEQTKKYTFYQIVIIGLLLFTASISVVYRVAATKKFAPYLLGKESKKQLLTDHLNFSYGDYYDTDNYFAQHITSKDSVLLYGFHNLYYVGFPFIHESWIKKGDRFNYIATQKATLPSRYKSWKKIYVNEKTQVNLYTDNKQFTTY